MFLSVLRQFFAAHQKFTWIQNNLKTKIMVEENFPTIQFAMPAVIIGRVTTGKPFERSLSRGLVEEKYEDGLINGITRSIYSGEIAIGRIDAVTPIEVYSLDPFIGEMIADECITLFNYSCFEKFNNAGLHIVDIRDGQQSEIAFGNDLFFKYNLEVQTYQEWEMNVTDEERDVIENISIPDFEGIISISPIDGVTNPNF